MKWRVVSAPFDFNVPSLSFNDSSCDTTLSRNDGESSFFFHAASSSLEDASDDPREEGARFPVAERNAREDNFLFVTDADFKFDVSAYSTSSGKGYDFRSDGLLSKRNATVESFVDADRSRRCLA